MKLVPVVVAWAALLGALLFADYWVSAANAGWTRTLALEIQAACRDPGTQWMIVGCLTVYFVTFLLIEGRVRNTTPSVTGRKGGILAFFAPFRGQCGNPNFWLAAFLLLVLARYAVDYTDAARSLQVVVLLTGIVVGKAAGLLSSGLRVPSSEFPRESRESTRIRSPESGVSSPESKVQSPESGAASSEPQTSAHQATHYESRATHHASRITPHPPFSGGSPGISRQFATLGVLTLLLAVAALWQPGTGMEFQYRGVRRWTGPWNNPNIYGLLMGVGVVLALGLLWVSGLTRILHTRNAGLGNPAYSDKPPCVVGRVPPHGEVSAFQSKCEISGLKSRVQSRLDMKRRGWEYVARLALLILLFAAAGLCAYGLLKSFSRGAWLGTAAGIAYLLWKRGQSPESAVQSREPRRIKPRTTHHASRITHLVTRLTHRCSRISVSVAVLLFSLLVICFWQFRHTEAPLARRVFSAANPNDFSWRNRVTVWGGSIRMMADHPWWGVGWGRVEPRFAQDYRPPRLEETMAVQLNDYFMLANSAGLPALLCFLACLITTFRHASRITHHGPRITHHVSLAAVCSAAAAVLLIGFWFDGGLFKLPTAVVFGTLLALAISGRLGAQMERISCSATVPAASSGSVSLPGVPAMDPRTGTMREPAGKDACATPTPHDNCHEGRQQGGHPMSKGEKALHSAAVAAALAALALTVLHLGAPQLAVHERSVRLARQWLVPAHERADFDFLAGHFNWTDSRLRTPLQHAHLAHYNRQLVNWRVEDALYRPYVLGPEIDPARDGDRHWRRRLWEHYYPRVRRESHPATAAEIIARDLRERVALSETREPPRTIAEIWQQQRSDAPGLAALYVAALRSVGVPARLSDSGHAEFHDGANWRSAL